MQIALLFPHNFWGDSDMFGHVASSTPTRGEYFLFYSYAVFSGGPLLIALVSGTAAYTFERMSAAEATARVMKVLRSIFAPKGVDVPSPLQVMTNGPLSSKSLGHLLAISVYASGKTCCTIYKRCHNQPGCLLQEYAAENFICHVPTCCSACV